MANAPLTSLTPRPRPALPPEEAAKPPPPPPPPLADVIAAAGLSGKVAVTVADAETGEVLEQVTAPEDGLVISWAEVSWVQTGAVVGTLGVVER